MSKWISDMVLISEIDKLEDYFSKILKEIASNPTEISFINKTIIILNKFKDTILNWEEKETILSKKYIFSKAHINAINYKEKLITFNNPEGLFELNDDEWKQFENQWSNEKSDYIVIWSREANKDESE